MSENLWKKDNLKSERPLTSSLEEAENEAEKSAERKKDGKKDGKMERWKISRDLLPLMAVVVIGIAQVLTMTGGGNENMGNGVQKIKERGASSPLPPRAKIRQRPQFSHCEPRFENKCKLGQTVVAGVAGNKCCE